MSKEILTFGGIEIEKTKFYGHKTPILWGNVAIEYYLHNDHKVKPLYKILPKTGAYVKSYDGQTKWMFFFD